MNNPIEHLYFRAKAQPDSVAIQTLERAISYRELLGLVRRIAYKLRQRGVGPGQVAVTRLFNTQTDWILTLALMHEAVVSCSNHGSTPIPAALAPDVILTARPLFRAEIPDASVLTVDGSWFEDHAPVPEIRPQPYPSDDSLFRLVLTSGTTGQSKAVGHEINTLQRYRTVTTLWESDATEITLLSLSTGMGHWSAMQKLLGGGTLYCGGSMRDVMTLISINQLRLLFGSPVQLSALVNEVKQHSCRLTSLDTVVFTGSTATSTFLHQLQNVLCPNVACLYGSTELGAVSSALTHTVDSNSPSAGYVLPEADLQIVDEEDQPLGTDQEGRIRVCTPYMATNYYRNPEATGQYFRDGWFYSGDRGRLTEDGMLLLAGRENEIINRGGAKIDPAAVDRRLMDADGVEDAATFAFENHGGIEDIAAALVVTEGFDEGKLRRSLIASLGESHTPSIFVYVDIIPRNEMGKPLRGQLREQHAGKLGHSQTS